MISSEIHHHLMSVCSVLNKHKVNCMLIGGTAVGFYGYQRISGISLLKPEIKNDLDFWYNPTTENFTSIVDALRELKVDVSSLEKIVFDPQKTYLKIPFDNYHVDFLPQMKGLASYADSKKKSKHEIIDGNEIFIIGLTDLIANKIATDRDIDQDDLSFLKKIQKEN
jgi:hypothetical protein